MSNFTEAFAQLLDAQAVGVGSRPQATVNGITGDAIISDINFDETFVDGGVAEGGGYEVQMLVSLFVTKPPKNAPAIVGGVTLQVMSVKQNNGVYIFTVGDAAI